MPAAIVTNHLTKYYSQEKVPALSKLSLQIEPGEIYGFLGANGAGKSTTIRLLLNFLLPSSGSATILGLDTVNDSVAVKSQVGYLSGDISLYQKPTGRQLLDYLSSLQKATPYRRVLEKRFKADLNKPIGLLSKGNKQKIGIIQAIMHEPKVLILDEPTTGLDPLMQEVFYKTLQECTKRGTAVLMSSHNLNEAQRVCDRIGIIKHGRLVKEQVIGQDTTLGSIIFSVTFASPAELRQAKSTPGLKLVSQTNEVTALLKPTRSIAAALTALGRFNIHDLTTQTIDLESEFLEFYGDKS